MGKIVPLLTAAKEKLQRDGLKSTFAKTREIVIGRSGQKDFEKNNPDEKTFYDVMFINGCDYAVPHPIRYRVDHQIQQLEANGVTCYRTDAWNFDIERYLGMARCFIIFRCPYADFLEDFVNRAKAMNKLVYFDIDDLVIDRKYTDTIPYLDTMSPEERAGYDDGVDRMNRMLRVCGNAITSTDALADELRTIVDGDVFVNRNVASEEMRHFSQRAVDERDVLPFTDPDKVLPDDRPHYEWARARHQSKVGKNEVTLGYFSGSITHNDDFRMIVPGLVEVMQARPNVTLLICGELNVPAELEPYQDRIRTSGFVPWQKLPQIIAEADINLVPLADTIFNRAKSENKWVEASLVKVPTIASAVGPFAQFIQDGETGVLVRDNADWGRQLLALVDDADLRAHVAKAAHAYVDHHYLTTTTGTRLANHLRHSWNKNIMMSFPSFNISGGVLVALRHCCILQDAGYDVTLIDNGLEYVGHTFEALGHTFPVLHAKSNRNRDLKELLYGSIDVAVATMWPTVDLFDEYARIGKRKYLVQNFETDFYQSPDTRRLYANRTYSRTDTEYITISQWCKRWLEDDFGAEVNIVPNGLVCADFSPVKRTFTPGEKIRILIEGDSKSYYKNVDEAFEDIALLDPERFEVWYMSYYGKPKPFYRVDKFLHAVPYEEVADVYRSCHILLKTSILESFSYPPLEMMATGGFVVAIPNDGNAEFLRDGENCLLCRQGDPQDAAAKILAIADNPDLQERLYAGGQATAQARDWSTIAPQIVELYQ